MPTNIENLEINLIMGAVVFTITAIILLRMVKNLSSSYKGKIEKIFLFSIFIYIIAWITQYLNYSFQAKLLAYLGMVIFVSGFAIAVWEEIKKGLEEYKNKT